MARLPSARALLRRCDTPRTEPGHAPGTVFAMRKLLRRGALIVALPLLAMTAACGSTERAASAPAGDNAGKKASSTTPDTKVPGTSGSPAPGLTAQELPAYQKLAKCIREQGLDVPEPKAGEPFDPSAVSGAFADPQNGGKFDKVLANCPDYKKLVVGVG
jgi:hypothetical protein